MIDNLIMIDVQLADSYFAATDSYFARCDSDSVNLIMIDVQVTDSLFARCDSDSIAIF